MWAINSIDELTYLEQERRPTAIMVATGFELHVVDWIYGAWFDIHSMSGMKWHLAVPAHINRRSDREKPLRSEYDEIFANELRELYGIGRDETPCLVFENWSDSEKQLTVKLHQSPEELKKLFISIAKKIDSMDRDGNLRSNRQMVDELYNHLQLQRMGGLVRTLTSKGSGLALRTLLGRTR